MTEKRRKGNKLQTAQVLIEILDAAFEVFSESGYKGATLKKVSEKVGLTEAGILHHFASKEILLMEVLSYRNRISEDLYESTSPGDRHFLEGWYKIIEHNLSHPSKVAFFVVMSAEATNKNHPAHLYFKERYFNLVQTLEKNFKNFQKRGLLKPDVNPRDLAIELVALSDGLQIQWLYDRNTPVLAIQREFIHRALIDQALDF
jgi:AcrR family transcriptional regulator